MSTYLCRVTGPNTGPNMRAAPGGELTTHAGTVDESKLYLYTASAWLHGVPANKGNLSGRFLQLEVRFDHRARVSRGGRNRRRQASDEANQNVLTLRVARDNYLRGQPPFPPRVLIMAPGHAAQVVI
jgi:hypothetical protein